MSTPLQPIPYAQFKIMTDAWEAGLWQVSNPLLQKKFPARAGIQEAKSGWVSKADLLKLLEDNGANGLRFYYGTHVASTLPGTAPFEYQGLHNFILVATVDSVNPTNPGFENSVDQLDKTATASSGSFKGMGGDIIPLCPPACQG
jgi:hypothetical protein